MDSTTFCSSARVVRQRVMKCLAVLLLWGLATLAQFAQGAETVTLLTAHETAAEQRVRDLLLVELSANAGIELVERANVRDLLQEQQISAFGDQSDSLLLGRLLGVDAFVVWEGTPVDAADSQQTSGRLVCFDGATGTRLGDQLLAGDDITQLARDAAQCVRNALKKRAVFHNDEIVLFSISSIRNVDLPAGLRERIPQLVVQVEQALIAQPGAALLERERLRFVLREHMLPIATQQAHLLAASQSITLEFTRTADNSIRVNVRVHHSDGETPIELEWLPDAKGGLEQLTQKISGMLATESPHWRKADSPDQSAIAHEAQRLESEARRLDAVQGFFGAAVRWEASYLLDKQERRLSMLLMSLERSLSLAMIDPITQTSCMQFKVYELNGKRRVNPDMVPPAPEEIWLRAIEIADYHLVLADYLGDHSKYPQSPYNELMTMSSFHWNLAYLNFKNHPFAILKARSYLDRFEALLLKRNKIDQPNPKIPMTESERQTHAATLRFRLFCGAKRYLLLDWEAQLLELARDLDVEDSRILQLLEVKEALIALSPSARQRFFEAMGASSGRKTEQPPLYHRYLQLWIDAYHGTPELKQTLDDRVGQFISDVIQQMCTPDSPVSHVRFAYGIVVSSGPITIPSGIGHGLWLISDASRLPGVRSGSQKRIIAFRALVEHDIVAADFIDNQLQPQNPEHRRLLEQALRVMEKNGSGYNNEDRSRLIAAIRTRLSPIPNTITLEPQLTRIYPPKLSPAGNTQIIHALPTPQGIILFTSRQDSQQAAWIVEMSLVAPGSLPQLQGTFAFPEQVVKDFEAKRSTWKFQGNRPLNFFELSFSTALPVVNEDYYLLPTAGGGILVFPRNGKASYVIDEAAGLPSNCIQALAVVNGTLYAWVGLQGIGGNNMVAVDMASQEIRNLISTEQEEMTSPLNNLPGGQCLGIVKSPVGESIYLLVAANTDDRNGLWMMDCKTSTFLPIYTAAYFSSSWLMTDGDQLVFGKRGLHFKKPGFKGGTQPSDRFSDAVTVNCKTNQWEESPQPQFMEVVLLPFRRSNEFTLWLYPAYSQFTIEQQSTGQLTSCRFTNLQTSERPKWTHLLDDQETMLLYSNQRAWTVKLSDLLSVTKSSPE